LDTHTLIWWLSDHPMLSHRARNAIREPDNRIHVSAASAWEIAIKTKAGNLTVPELLLADFMNILQGEGFDPLEIAVGHAIRAGTLPALHRDPFDRMLIAQSQAESLTLIGKDRIFDKYGINRLW
jgi:PIN domain nuclease of toxin-antitoxin system